METGFGTMVVIGPLVMVLVAVIARAAAAGRIRRNHAVGIRLPSTLASDCAWHAGHRAAVAPAVAWAVVLLLADVAAITLRSRGTPLEVLTLALVVLILIAVAWIVVVSTRAARAEDHAPR